MATLQKIRNKAGILIAIVIGGALIAFIAGDVIKSGGAFFAQSRNMVAEIAGEEISITDLNRKIDETVNISRALSQRSALSSEERARITEQTWNQLVKEYIMNPQYAEIGLGVSDDEIYELVFGNEPHEVVKQYFRGQDGKMINKSLMIKNLQAMVRAPRGSAYRSFWAQINKEINDSKLVEKYNSLLQSGISMTEANAKEVAEFNSKKVDFSYFVKPYSSIEDKKIVVTDNEIQNYYNKFKNKYKQLQETRDIEYVAFDIEPSTRDFDKVKKVAEKVKINFEKAENVEQFVNVNSDTKFDNKYYKKGDIKNAELDAFAFGDNEGKVLGIYEEDGAYKMARIAETKVLPDSVKLRHIIIQAKLDKNKQIDTKAAYAKADSLLKLINSGKSFAEVAKANSEDKQTAAKGGDLGWIQYTSLGANEYLNLAFDAKENKAAIYKTQYGAFIYEVTKKGKSSKKVKVGVIDKKVEASNATISKVYSKATDFAYKCKSKEEFDKFITEKGLNKKIANAINKNTKRVAGLTEPRQLIRAVFDAELNTMIAKKDGHNTFQLGDKFVVAYLTKVNEKGYNNIANVRSQIVKILTQKKKAEILKKQIEKDYAGSQTLTSIASKQGVQVKEATGVNFSSLQIQGEGIEPNVIATAVMSAKSKISKPIIGNKGVYVLVVNNVEKGKVETAAIDREKQTFDRNVMFAIQYQYFRALFENAKVEDNRINFF